MKIILNGHGLPTRARRLKRRRLLPNHRRSAQHVDHRDGKGNFRTSTPDKKCGEPEHIHVSRRCNRPDRRNQTSGYKVIVDNVGAVPLAHRDRSPAWAPDHPARRLRDDKVTKVLYTTVYVDVKC
jgi:hypothetical protein